MFPLLLSLFVIITFFLSVSLHLIFKKKNKKKKYQKIYSNL